MDAVTEEPTATQFTGEDYARKIDGLLKKAEQAGSAAEAEAFTAKAQQLMSKYAIDEAMLAAASGAKEKTQTVIREEIVYTGSYSQSHWDIGREIAQANECRTLIQKGTFNPDKGKYDAYRIVLIVIGFEEDVKRVRMLNASLQIQAQGALNKWWKTVDSSWMTAMDKYKERRQFLGSFAQGLGVQLENAAALARAAAEAERGDKDSVALVLRDKKSRVDDWIDAEYGKLRNVRRRAYGGSGHARVAGTAAGMRANTGSQGEVSGGNAGQLGR